MIEFAPSQVFSANLPSYDDGGNIVEYITATGSKEEWVAIGEAIKSSLWKNFDDNGFTQRSIVDMHDGEMIHIYRYENRYGNEFIVIQSMHIYSTWRMQLTIKDAKDLIDSIPMIASDVKTRMVYSREKVA